tara:strand:- start:296 stop:817 length:522 start_codon:yes stop_codon:yes gene_type:complete
MKNKKILAFGASNSKSSINKELASYVAFKISNDVDVIDLNEYEVEIYSEDRERVSGIPEKIKELYKKIGEVDLIVISFAEHNGTYSAAYKNIMDWLSRINVEFYQNKEIIMLSASPGQGGASNVLLQAVNSSNIFGGNVLFSYALQSFNDNFSEGKVISPKVEEVLNLKIKSI